MSRMTRLGFLVLILTAGLAGGCKSSSGCSSCGAQAPAAPPAPGELAPAVA